MTQTDPASVRSSCAWVVQIAEHVRVVGDLERYARSFEADRIAAPAWDEAHHFRGSEDATVAYVVTLDAVNFGSGWFSHLRKREGMSGYHTIASRLADRFEAEGPLAAERLAAMRAEDVADIFEQPLDDADVAELMDRFAEAWRQLGALLIGRYEGSPSRLVAAAEGRADRLMAILVAMPFYRDVATYRGREIAFYKRAQITASDLSLALGGEGLGRFEDLDELTVFADNLVPHVLRVDGVLAYDDDLAARIARGDRLDAGSPEEVEIRASAVDAVERMVAAVRADGVRISARDVDVALWNRGQEPRYREVPRHRTRTVYY